MKPGLLAFTLFAAATTSGCAGPEIFDRVTAPESADVAAAAYPRLADTPTPPPAGVYDAASPDPAIGEAAIIDLAVEAELAETRRKSVEGPVE